MADNFRDFISGSSDMREERRRKEAERKEGMLHAKMGDDVSRPPLRTFVVRSDDNEDHEVTAHLVFDNTDRGEGLVFRRYYDDSVRTEKVAEFKSNTWKWYKEKPNGN